jgi:hypothetical protein
MNVSIIRYILGHIIKLEGFFMLLPCTIALVFHEKELFTYLAMSVVCILLGSLLTFKKAKDTVFSIKLFGSIRKNVKIIVKENGDYLIRKYYAFLSSKSQALLFSDSKPKPYDKYDFGIEGIDKYVRRIILQHPAAVEMRQQPHHGSEVVVDNSDVLFGNEIYSTKAFIEKCL